MVAVNGHRLHLHRMGDVQPGPTVILDAGMVSFSPNWAWVQPEVARAAPVVAYDRAGLGWSETGPAPRDAAQSAKELHEALIAAAIPGPYVLAGHSYGGLVVRAFAALYRQDVAGMVLVDASHPDQWARFGISSKVPANGNRIGAVLIRLGLSRLLRSEYELLTRGLPPRQAAELMALALTPRSLATAGAALRVWDSHTRPFINQAATLGDLPLVVLSVTEQPRMSQQLTALQAELPALSTNSQHLTVQGAYHEGLVAQPEHAQVVTDAILRVVQAARTGAALN